MLGKILYVADSVMEQMIHLFGLQLEHCQMEDLLNLLASWILMEHGVFFMRLFRLQRSLDMSWDGGKK